MLAEGLVYASHLGYCCPAHVANGSFTRASSGLFFSEQLTFDGLGNLFRLELFLFGIIRIKVVFFPGHTSRRQRPILPGTELQDTSVPCSSFLEMCSPQLFLCLLVLRQEAVRGKDLRQGP